MVVRRRPVTARMTGAWNTVPATPKPTSPTLSMQMSSIARHDEQRSAVELVNRPQPIGVVVLRDVHDFLLRCHARERHAVVESAVDADQATVLLPHDQIEREIAEGHRDDRIECVWIAGAHEIAEPLVDHIDATTLVIPR